MKTDKFYDESETKTPITLSGTAGNAKAGATLKTDDGRVVYIDGFDEWDDELAGERLQLTGILSKREFPSNTETESSHIQHISGTSWMLKLTEPYKK